MQGDGTSISHLMLTGGYFEKPAVVKPVKALKQSEITENYKNGGVEW